MSWRRADARFLLPWPAVHVAVFGIAEWKSALESADIRVSGKDGTRERIELAVAGLDDLDAALACHPDMLIVEGRGAARRLRKCGWSAVEFLPLPSLADPVLVLPLRHRQASAYAVRNMTAQGAGLRRWRNWLGRTLLAAGALPPVRPTMSIGLREASQPFLVARAAELFDLPRDVEWFLVNGEGRAFRRGAFMLFAPGAATPSWALKFARERGDAEPFARDQRGLQAAESGGSCVSSHAPRFLGLFDVAGFHASLESAAPGRRLDRILADPNLTRASKLALVERIAQWAVDVMAATRKAPARADGNRERAVAQAVAHGVRGDLLAGLASVPSVLQHNDLWTWHLIIDDERFVAIDWEFASGDGLPLWDLWYFLFDVGTQLDRAAADDRERYFVRLFRGEEPFSKLLFDWTRRAIEVLALPEDSVGPLATAIWQQYGIFYTERLGEHHLADPTAPPRGRRLPDVWLNEPGLGPTWNAWRT